MFDDFIQMVHFWRVNLKQMEHSQNWSLKNMLRHFLLMLSKMTNGITKVIFSMSVREEELDAIKFSKRLMLIYLGLTVDNFYAPSLT